MAPFAAAAFRVFVCALAWMPPKIGIAIATRIPRTTTTMISSMSEKPASSPVTIAVFVIVNAIVRDSPARRVRRAERAQHRLDRAVRSAAHRGIVPRPAPSTPRPFANEVGTVGTLDRSGFVEPGLRASGPRDWAPDGR